MRSINWKAVIAASILSVPTLVLAQSDDARPNDPRPAQITIDLKPDPFFGAVQTDDDSVYATKTDAKPRVNVRIDAHRDGKDSNYTRKTLQTFRFTSDSGAALTPVPPAMAAQLRLDKGVGVVVEQVAPGSVFEAAGVEQYDVIEKVDHRQIRNQNNLTSTLRGGDRTVSIDIIRQGHRQTLSLHSQPGQNKAFTFGGESSYSGPQQKNESRNENNNENVDGKRDRDDRNREQADKDRERSDRDREKADRDRDRQVKRDQEQQAHQKFDAMRRDREQMIRDQEQKAREQLQAMQQQLQGQLERERAELDRAREQLNRAQEEINRKLADVRKQLDSELKQKREEMMQKMGLLEQQSRDLQQDEKPEPKE